VTKIEDAWADLWGEVYQTENDEGKKNTFKKNYKSLAGNAPKEEIIQQTLDKVIPAFKGDFGTNQDKLREFMYRVALHESLGGTYDTQQGGGPAQGYWQVEPETARDVLTNSSALIGPKAQEVMGYSKSQLLKMNEKELEITLRNPKVNLVFATAKTLAGAKAKGKLEVLA
jgi:hypothetical protein